MLDTAVAHDYAVIRTNGAEAPQAIVACPVDDGADRKGIVLDTIATGPAILIAALALLSLGYAARWYVLERRRRHAVADAPAAFPSKPSIDLPLSYTDRR